MLTIFTCPKPFTDPHIQMIQRNALISWMRLKPVPEIVLVGDDKGVADVAKEYDLRQISSVENNECGTPLVPSIFAKAEQAASNRVLAYVNCDMLLFQDFLAAVQVVSDLPASRPFLMVGQRWDVDVDRTMALTDGRVAGETDWAETTGRLWANAVPHGSTGIDYFVYRSGFWPAMPPFALGRCAWDNWLLWSCLDRRGALVDATPSVKALHQNHHYRHASDTTKHGVWNGEEARRNRVLSKGKACWITDASHVVVRERVRFARSRDKVWQRIRRLRKKHPALNNIPFSWKAQFAYCWLNPYAGS